MGLGHFNGFGLFRGSEVAIHNGVRRNLESPRLVIFVHGQGLVLPDIPEGGDESDVTALAFQVVRDVLHLFYEELVGIEGKPFSFLVGIVQVVLGIRNHRDGERFIIR